MSTIHFLNHKQIFFQYLTRCILQFYNQVILIVDQYQIIIINFNKQMGKNIPKTQNKEGKKKSKKPSKDKNAPVIQQNIQQFPVYQNQEDIPVFDPNNMAINYQNQNKKKKKKKIIKQQIQQEEVIEEPVQEDLPQNIIEPQNQQQQNIEDSDLGPEENFDQIAQEIEQEAQEGVQQNNMEDQDQNIDMIDEQNPLQQKQGKDGKKKNMDIALINMKIQEILSILGNIPVLGDGKPRSFYLEELKKHLHTYYGYNFELIDHFLTFLNPNQLIQFFEANETQRPLTIRVNTLKTRRKQLAQSLIQRGVNLDPLAEWSKVGIKIYESRVPIGATPEYLAGHYMLQSASSLLPVIALEAKAGERILDLAAAPGGKTTYIAQMMKNTGVIFANDSKKERLRALQFNVQRLGISNIIVTNYDGRKINKVINNFDRVLLDAPCTGLGIISKDHSIKGQKLLIDIYKHSHLQKQLILAAVDATKVNGVIVYSTCSVSPLQNQEVVNYCLKRRYVKVIDMPVQIGEPGVIKYIEKRYHPDLAKTRRIYPHVHNMDGFYYAKLIKISNGEKKVKQENQEEVQEEPNLPVQEIVQEQQVQTKQIKKKKKIKKSKQ